MTGGVRRSSRLEQKLIEKQQPQQEPTTRTEIEVNVPVAQIASEKVHTQINQRENEHNIITKDLDKWMQLVIEIESLAPERTTTTEKGVSFRAYDLQSTILGTDELVEEALPLMVKIIQISKEVREKCLASDQARTQIEALCQDLERVTGDATTLACGSFLSQQLSRLSLPSSKLPFEETFCEMLSSSIRRHLRNVFNETEIPLAIRCRSGPGNMQFNRDSLAALITTALDVMHSTPDLEKSTTDSFLELNMDHQRDYWQDIRNGVQAKKFLHKLFENPVFKEYKSSTIQQVWEEHWAIIQKCAVMLKEFDNSEYPHFHVLVDLEAVVAKFDVSDFRRTELLAKKHVHAQCRTKPQKQKADNEVIKFPDLRVVKKKVKAIAVAKPTQENNR